MDTPNAVVTPQGWSIQGGLEASQMNGLGQVVQGMKFQLVGPGQVRSTLFVPYTDLGNTAAVQAAVDDRIASITAITG